MFALVLLAQVASATPAPPAPTPTPALALGTASSAVSGKQKTLAELAKERKLGKKGVTGGTLSVSGSGAPASTGDAAPAAPSEDGGGAPVTLDDRSARIQAAQNKVAAASRALDDVASAKGMTSEDATLARKRLMEAERELDEAKTGAPRR